VARRIRLRDGGDVLADVWKTAPFMALLLLAGLQVIPDDLYDARDGGRGHGVAALRARDAAAAHAGDPRRAHLPTLDALRIFDLPYVLTRGSNGTTTLSLLANQELADNRLVRLGSALSVLTFIIVMAVSFLYIRTVDGNIRALAEEK
jgi:multiple sugar transport system permease protein